MSDKYLEYSKMYPNVCGFGPQSDLDEFCERFEAILEEDQQVALLNGQVKKNQANSFPSLEDALEKKT